MVLLLLLLLVVVVVVRGNSGGGDFLFSFFLGGGDGDWDAEDGGMVVGLLGQIWYIISYAMAVVRCCLFFVIYTF